jgi:Ca2+:H+ antiporter
MNPPVNLIKIKTAAHRLGRSADGLRYGWMNPFNRYQYKTPPRRANTLPAAEEGRANSNETSTPLQHAATAPDILQTPVDRGFRPSEELDDTIQGDDTYDSQATTAASPIAGHGRDGPRNRRQKILGVSFGGSHSKEKEEDDDKKNHPKSDFTFKNQIQRTLFSSPLNILLLAAPAGIVIWALKIPGPAVFVVNFIAIIPLAAMLADATEEIADRTGETLGGLINATFG